MICPQLVYDMESDILARIAYYLSRGAVASADWQTRKLSQLGALTKDAQANYKPVPSSILLQTGKAVEESGRGHTYTDQGKNAETTQNHRCNDSRNETINRNMVRIGGY
jgi:hypothetical protein